MICPFIDILKVIPIEYSLLFKNTSKNPFKFYFIESKCTKYPFLKPGELHRMVFVGRTPRRFLNGVKNNETE